MRRAMPILLCLLAAHPASAQVRTAPVTSASPDDQDEPPPPPQQTQTRPNQAGRVADSAVGEVGQRQTREQAPAGIQPMARVSGRIQNRVQSRIRNRIDRNYDPQANATAPFATAEEQSRTAGRPNR